MFQLFPDQLELKAAVFAAWAQGAMNVCMQLATGGGKTAIFCNIIAEHDGKSIIIAHRSELVGQISLTLARYGVRHKLIAAKETQRGVINIHLAETGKNFISQHSNVTVASVDTLIRLGHAPWMDQITLVVQDEGHHVTRENKWGIAAAKFRNARGLYPTATPLRGDGLGLGKHADGIQDVLVCGRPQRELIKMGRLCDYEIVCPESDIDYSEVNVTASGELNYAKLRAAVHKSSRIVGDVVSAYLQWAKGKLGITFAVDVEAAIELCDAYRKAGVPAEVITGDTPEAVRVAIMRRFRAREVLQLVSVDILGEGVDVPAVEVVSFARKTESFALYCQQFGRALRVMIGKRLALIIDHVGNVVRHGLPDAPRVWGLNRADKRARTTTPAALILRVCLNPRCVKPFARILDKCPYCSMVVAPRGRSSPELVEGNLLLLDLDVLNRMREEVTRIDSAPSFPHNASPEIVGAIKKQHHKRQVAQAELRGALELWGGYQKHKGYTDTEGHKLFWLTYGIDVLSAQALGAKDAEELYLRIAAQLMVDGVVKAA